MSKLRAWHILVPTVLLVVAWPVAGTFALYKPSKQQVDDLARQIDEANKKAAMIHVREAELDQAKAISAQVQSELLQMKSLKMPVAAGNPWWRELRGGMAFTPGSARIRMGERDQVVDLPDGYPLMFDMLFELREDLGPVLRNYFNSTGVAVCDFSLPAPELRAYDALELIQPIRLIPTGTPVTTGVPGLVGSAQSGGGRMTVQGKYQDVLRFLRRIGDAPRLIRVDGPIVITAVPGMGGAGGDEVVATMDMSVYLLPNLSPDMMSQLGPALAAAGGGGAGGGGMGGGMMGGMMGGMGMGAGMGGGMGGGAGAPPSAPVGAAGSTAVGGGAAGGGSGGGATAAKGA